MVLISRHDWTVQCSKRFTPTMKSLHPSGTVSFVLQLALELLPNVGVMGCYIKAIEVSIVMCKSSLACRHGLIARFLA